LSILLRDFDFNFCRIINIHSLINFIVKFKERLLSLIIKSIQANFDCFSSILEDTVSPNDMSQTTSADNLIDTTIVKSFTNDICPVGKLLGKARIINFKRIAKLIENLTLNRAAGIFLLKGYTETLKESFIQNISADEATVIRTLALCIGSSNNIKSFRSFLPNLVAWMKSSARSLLPGQTSFVRLSRMVVLMK